MPSKKSTGKGKTAPAARRKPAASRPGDARAGGRGSSQAKAPRAGSKGSKEAAARGGASAGERSGSKAAVKGSSARAGAQRRTQGAASERREAVNVRSGAESAGPAKRRAGAPTTKATDEGHRKRLLESRASLLKDLVELREELRGLQEPSHELEEWAQEEKDRDILIRLELRNKEELQRIQSALLRLDEGSYGQCARCGRKIGKERLQEIPTALFCRTCQGA